MELFVIWAFLGLIPSMIAKNKGRDAFLWWLYGALIFPVALVHSLLISPDQQTADARELSSGKQKCPFCAEFIRPEAAVCKHCGRDLPVPERV